MKRATSKDSAGELTFAVTGVATGVSVTAGVFTTSEAGAEAWVVVVSWVGASSSCFEMEGFVAFVAFDDLT